MECAKTYANWLSYFRDVGSQTQRTLCRPTLQLMTTKNCIRFGGIRITEELIKIRIVGVRVTVTVSVMDSR